MANYSGYVTISPVNLAGGDHVTGTTYFGGAGAGEGNASIVTLPNDGGSLYVDGNYMIWWGYTNWCQVVSNATSGNMFTITSNQTDKKYNDWGGNNGVLFNNIAGSSNFEYIIIEYAARALNPRSTSTQWADNLTFRYNIIRYCASLIILTSEGMATGVADSCWFHDILDMGAATIAQSYENCFFDLKRVKSAATFINENDTYATKFNNNLVFGYPSDRLVFYYSGNVHEIDGNYIENGGGAYGAVAAMVAAATITISNCVFLTKHQTTNNCLLSGHASTGAMTISTCDICNAYGYGVRGNTTGVTLDDVYLAGNNLSSSYDNDDTTPTSAGTPPQYQNVNAVTNPRSTPNFPLTISNIAESGLGDNGVTIANDTGIKAQCFVEYGTASGVYTMRSNPSNDGVWVYQVEGGTANYDTSHSMAMVNLKPGTKYYYRVIGTDPFGRDLTASAEGDFTTTETPSIAVDVQGNISDVTPAPTDTLLITGNIQASGNANVTLSVKIKKKSDDSLIATVFSNTVDLTAGANDIPTLCGGTCQWTVDNSIQENYVEIMVSDGVTSILLNETDKLFFEVILAGVVPGARYELI